MLPEEQELVRLEGEQFDLEDQVTSAELLLETTKAEITRFQHRYYKTVGRLYAQVDDLDAALATRAAAKAPNSTTAQARAQEAQDQAKKSAEESGLIEALPQPPQEISSDLKLAYRRAAKLIHPDRATIESERLRRTELMKQVNRAYEAGDLKAIEKLIADFGQDPESITGEDVASRIVKAIRRIAQLRRRISEVQLEIDQIQETEICRLKNATEEAESEGNDPLGDLAKQLTVEISKRKSQLGTAVHGGNP